MILVRKSGRGSGHEDEVGSRPWVIIPAMTRNQMCDRRQGPSLEGGEGLIQGWRRRPNQGDEGRYERDEGAEPTPVVIRATKARSIFQDNDNRIMARVGEFVPDTEWTHHFFNFSRCSPGCKKVVGVEKVVDG